jgi:hypothetical protein
VFLLGGLGRLLSLALHGWPQWFQVVLAVIELGLPPIYFWLADADERAFATAEAEAGAGASVQKGAGAPFGRSVRNGPQ